jgi:hypothetical protein
VEVATVIVPAHDEEAVIGRLLRGLTAGSETLCVVVVCNGCTDGTGDTARSFPGVTVLETPQPSKQAALRLGDGYAEDFPRVYVDADVEIDHASVLALVAAVERPGVLAAAPRRVIPRAGVSWPVRWYYDVWESIPGVRGGLFGRGVVALSRAGHERLAGLPSLLSDDLAASSAFEDGERVVVPDAVVVVHPPRTWADLVRRRVRVVTGTRQAYEGEARLVLRTDSRTRSGDLVAAAAGRPTLWFKVPVFLATTLIARRRAARAVAAGDFSTWLRDGSSRTR